MKEDTALLIKKAENDLKDAKILFKSKESSIEGICFHAQQAVEKYLKAYLVFNNKEINKTHDIAGVLRECENIDADFVKLKEANIDDLTNYAVSIRYDEILELSTEDAEKAISLAEKTAVFIRKKLNLKQEQKSNCAESDDFTKDLENRHKKGLKR